KVREQSAGEGLHLAGTLTETLHDVGENLCLIGLNLGRRRIGVHIRADGHDAMAVARRERRARRIVTDPEITAEPRANGGDVAPRDVIAVPGEVLPRKLPVGRHDPLVQAPHNFDAALLAIEEQIQVPRHFAEVLAQRWGFRIERGEDEALVALELRDRDETPLLALEG